ncbi:MAG: ribonuclease J [Candidatus Gracilibacteria bacterium]|nr:ribonuclease J [Candidatus Gracilibacteria bacterium]
MNENLNKWLSNQFKGEKPVAPTPASPKQAKRKWLNKNKQNQPKLRIVGLGGFEEVGRNMMIFEYGKEIVIIDMGLQFPEGDMLGIDYLVPDISYLKGKEDRIRGIIITHGHYDHIGAIPHLMPELGEKIPIYATPLTLALIKKRQEEFGRSLNLRTINPDEKLKLGLFTAEFFRVNHNIPDCVAVALHTPVGTVVHTGDWKMDLSPINDKPIELNKIAKLGEHGVLALLADSTNAYKPGYQISERKIQESLDKIFIDAKGRILTATFASLLTRVQQIVTLSQKHGRKIVIEGRSMKNNIEIAKQFKYLKYPEKIFISAGEANKLPDDKVVIMGTGAQGEENAALMRIASKKHPKLSIKKGDTVIFSSSVVPGNELSVVTLVDKLYRQGATVMNYEMMDIHAGGHAKAEEAKLLVQLLKPKFFVPIQANHSMLCMHAQVIKSTGFPEQNILIPQNGQMMEFTPTQARKLDEIVIKKIIAVDGKGVGDVGPVVLDDRRAMASAGIFVVVLTVDSKNGKLIGNPDIVSRGFIYMRNSEKLIEGARQLTKSCYENHKKMVQKEVSKLKDILKKDLSNYLYKETKREPLVVPVVIKVGWDHNEWEGCE